MSSSHADLYDKDDSYLNIGPIYPKASQAKVHVYTALTGSRALLHLYNLTMAALSLFTLA